MDADNKLRPAEVEKWAREQGILQGAELLWSKRQIGVNVLTAFAHGAAAREHLFSEEDAQSLSKLSNSEFFQRLPVICDIIPYLDAAPGDLMTLVSALVEKGGEDLAANQPNAAFRKWCAAEKSRSDEVIAMARGGDELALQHLVFALEAKGDVSEALQSVEARCDEQIAGVLALSRMDLSAGDAARALTAITAQLKDQTDKERAGMAKAMLDIAAKHNLDRSPLIEALKQLQGSTDPVVIHILTTALHQHGTTMSESEIDLCLQVIRNIDPDNAGTVQQLDFTLGMMWPVVPGKVQDVLSDLLSRSEGKVGKGALERILNADKPEQHALAVRLVTSWLYEGNPSVCAAIAGYISEINRTTPWFDVTPEVLPDEPRDQLFVCRKAVGFFILAPMTAAAWCVAALRRGSAVSEQVAELLLNPLLINYGGALREWLETQLEHDALGNDLIADALKVAQEIRDGMNAAGDVVELEPSTSCRALVAFREAEENHRIQEEAQGRSVLASLVTTQTLLYGDRSAFSIHDGEGKMHTKEIQMAEFSVRTEIPLGTIFDPIGTEMMIEQMRYERKVAP